MWDDEDCRSFVKTNFPDFLETYDAYPYPIQRADAFRYLVLFKEGGVYADLDTECLRSFEELASTCSFFSAFEPDEHAKIHNVGQILGNAIFGSVAGHPFLNQVIHHLRNDRSETFLHRDVLTSTGPLMLTSVYRLYQGSDLTLLPSHTLYPVSDLNGSYAIHYWSNSWIRNLAGELKSPDPIEIKGFTFFPGLDSPGFDLLNAGRDIAKIALCYKDDSQVAGFNTDGFVKHRIRPRYRWEIMPEAGSKEGLYIRDTLIGWRSLNLLWGLGRAGTAAKPIKAHQPANSSAGAESIKDRRRL